MFGFVTSVRAVEDTFMHTAVTASGRYVVIAKDKFKPGTMIEFSGTECRIDEDTTEVKAKSVKEAAGKSLNSEKEKIDAFIRSKCVPLKTKPLIDDAVIRKMSKTFDRAAAMIMEAAFLRRPIIIRYDTDSDGLCAGLAIYEALLDSYNLKDDEAMFPYYKNLNADDDIRYFNSLEAEHLPPLLICVDFGANPESRAGYEAVRAAGFSIIVIDHHPMHDPSVKELMDVLVSGIDAAPSDKVIHYTSGLLASEVAKRIKPLDTDWMARVAMAGDRSALITPTAKEQRHSEALMFALATSKYKHDLNSFLRLVKDEEEMDFAYAQA
jgi:RecJ-like exonuclease